MKIFKYDHSCFIVEQFGHFLVFDPVEYTTQLPDLPEIDAVIITHLHQDHCQIPILQKLLAQHPQTPIYTSSDNLISIDNVCTFDQSKLTLPNFNLDLYGTGEHEPLLPGQSAPCQNLSVIVDGLFANPADSYNSPKNPIPVLAVPIAAPWSDISKARQLIESANPKFIIPCHEAVLSEFGNQAYSSCLRQLAETAGAQFCQLSSGEYIEI